MVEPSVLDELVGKTLANESFAAIHQCGIADEPDVHLSHARTVADFEVAQFMQGLVDTFGNAVIRRRRAGGSYGGRGRNQG